MRIRRLILIVSALLMAAPGLASAADGASEPKASGPRKDPKGITGISPYTEKVNEGTSAFLARDYAKASNMYRQAIEMSPNKPLAHYLMGEALLAAGKLGDAEKAWQDASRFSKDDASLHAKSLFALADLKERQNKWQEAAMAWKEYAAYVGSVKEAKGYPETPQKRQQAFEKHQDLKVKYAKVKERIAQREADALAKKKR